MPDLIIDTNLLYLFVLGTHDLALIGQTKRVKQFTPDDFETLVQYISLFKKVVLLPNILAETSNFVGQAWGPRHDHLRSTLAEIVRGAFERYVPSSLAVLQPEYPFLGLTDAAILSILDQRTVLLTADTPLYLAALARGQVAEHFQALQG